MANSQPPLHEIINIFTPLLEDKYFELGIQLGLKPEHLKAIEHNYATQSRRFAETIILWQNSSTGDQPGWLTLADAVQRVGGYDKFEKELRARHLSSRTAQSLLPNACPSLGAHSKNDTVSVMSQSTPVNSWSSHSLTSSDLTFSVPEEISNPIEKGTSETTLPHDNGPIPIHRAAACMDEHEISSTTECKEQYTRLDCLRHFLHIYKANNSIITTWLEECETLLNNVHETMHNTS